MRSRTCSRRDCPVRDCLFCDVTQHRILWESTDWYVRYDNVPATLGHVEVVPRRHVESLFDLDAAEIAKGLLMLRIAQRMLTAEHHPDGWNIGINDGRAAGRSIDHLHIHLIPRYWGDQPDPRGGIRRGLPNGDPDKWAVQLAALERTDT
jgi:diadenosine tetraphosphate (Ap4A) HIT family hydrolase